MIDKSNIESQFARITSMIQRRNKKPVFINGNYAYEFDEVLLALRELKDSVLNERTPCWHSRREEPKDESKLEPCIPDKAQCYRLLCLISTPDRFFQTRFETISYVPGNMPHLNWLDFYIGNRIIKWAYFNDIAEMIEIKTTTPINNKENKQ